MCRIRAAKNDEVKQADARLNSGEESIYLFLTAGIWLLILFAFQSKIIHTLRHWFICNAIHRIPYDGKFYEVLADSKNIMVKEKK